MMIGVGVLALLALIFAMIDARSAHGRWEIGVGACSLAGGILLAVWTNAKAALGLGGYFGLKLTGGAVGAVDFVLISVIFFLACYALASLVGGFISPLKKGEKFNNSILRLIAFALCGLVGLGCFGYFLFIAGKSMMSGGRQELGGIAMIAAGAVYFLIGIAGVSQWNNRRKRISREKAELKAAAAAAEAAAAEAAVVEETTAAAEDATAAAEEVTAE
ncbi:MAG: hypothetical protein IKU32_07195 [Clostridia bacterium]|nr:hypothetical protein [Clostridia bacterium]